MYEKQEKDNTSNHLSGLYGMLLFHALCRNVYGMRNKYPMSSAGSGELVSVAREEV